MSEGVNRRTAQWHSRVIHLTVFDYEKHKDFSLKLWLTTNARVTKSHQPGSAQSTTGTPSLSALRCSRPAAKLRRCKAHQLLVCVFNFAHFHFSGKHPRAMLLVRLSRQQNEGLVCGDPQHPEAPLTYLTSLTQTRWSTSHLTEWIKTQINSPVHVTKTNAQ